MRPLLKILQDDLIEKILIEAKRILSEIGVEVCGPGLRQRLLDYGLRQDPDTGRVFFPPEVVDKAVTTTPRSFILYDREGNHHAEIGGNNVHFVPGSSGLKVLDHQTGQTRLANSADFVEYVRLGHDLPHIAYLATAFSTNDIEPQVSDAWRLYLCLTNSTKPIVSGAFTAQGVPRMVEMMQLFRHNRTDLIDRPMSIFTVTPTGMFRYGEDSCQNLIDCVESGIPVEIVPVTLMGLIAPVTMVGATVMHIAEVLAGLTMAQIIKPGAPVLFGGAPATFHMKSGTSPMAAIEALQLDVAYVNVAKSLDLPTQSYMALSEGKYLDAQAGAETFGSALLAALAGINSVSGPGMLDYVMVFSLEKLIFDAEMCGQALHFVREIRPLEDMPTVDLVRELLDEGHMLTLEHTLKHWPEELYLPGPPIDRLNREDWAKIGQPTLLKLAHDEVTRRLNAYRQIETEHHIDAEMRRIVRAGMTGDDPLPEVPEHVAKRAAEVGRRRRRRRRGTQ